MFCRVTASHNRTGMPYQGASQGHLVVRQSLVGLRQVRCKNNFLLLWTSFVTFIRDKGRNKCFPVLVVGNMLMNFTVSNLFLVGQLEGRNAPEYPFCGLQGVFSVYLLSSQAEQLHADL